MALGSVNTSNYETLKNNTREQEDCNTGMNQSRGDATAIADTTSRLISEFEHRFFLDGLGISRAAILLLLL